jgi:excisionase family DNA binding protein
MRSWPVGNVMSVEEGARYLKVHCSTIYRLLKTHQILAFRIGSDWRFNCEHLDARLAQLQSHK